MKKNTLVIFFTLALFGLTLFSLVPQMASPVEAQVFYFTPTADSSGNINYTVKEGDTCDSIALLNNLSVDALRSVNQLTVDDCRFLTVGTRLILGTVPTQVITPGPSPTPTNPIPTPQPMIGTGTLCIYLFNDTNGNGMVEDGEGPIADGQVSISSTASNTSLTGKTLATADNAPLCFAEIPESTYSISMAIPEGYNATASQNMTVQLKAGDTATVNFSAQPSSKLGSGKNAGGNQSILLAVIGGLVLIAGIGLGLYVRLLMGKPRNK